VLFPSAQGKSRKRSRSVPKLRVKELAQAQGLSMAALSRNAELAYVTLKKIYRNPYKKISLRTLLKLAKALGVAPLELYEEATDSEEPP
jgi:lambda repressor-like predicted transcriptional regulator